MSKRSLPALFLFASLGAAVGAGVFAPAPAQAKDEALDCNKFKDFPKIKNACTSGADTEKKMRHQMKDWQKAAKKKGGDFKCTTCHEKSSGGKTKGSPDEVKKKWGDFEKLL
jgi:hypothetical protein